MDDDFDIPELNRIGALMRELSGEPAWPDPAAGDRPAKAAARPAARRKPRARPRPLAALRDSDRRDR